MYGQLAFNQHPERTVFSTSGGGTTREPVSETNQPTPPNPYFKNFYSSTFLWPIKLELIYLFGNIIKTNKQKTHTETYKLRQTDRNLIVFHLTFKMSL